MRSPFSLYIKKLKTGAFWYARFTHENGDYAGTLSTGIPCTGKKGRKNEAYEVAKKLSENIVVPDAPYFIDYIEAFWKADSPYVKSKRLAEKKPITNQYIANSASGIRLHVKPFTKFQRLRLADLKSGMIEDWKIWALEKGVGARRINAILQSMAVPVRYALSREEIENDPFKKIKKVAYTEVEKGVLSKTEVANLLSSKDKDPRVTVAVKLAVLTGIRRGEVRGLRWKDFDFTERLIHITTTTSTLRVIRNANGVQTVMCFSKCDKR